MKLIAGILIGVFYAALCALALRHSSGSWEVGHSDLGFWWAVIGVLLGVAGMGALIGSWIHTRPSED